MGIWSRIKRGSIDRSVGGYLPGGVSPGSTTTTPSTTTTTTPTTSAPSSSTGSSSSSSSGSSSSSVFSGGGGSYNPVTKTYTSPSGEKQSRAYSNVPSGTAIEIKAPTSSGGGSTTSSSSGKLGTVIVPGVSTVDKTGYIGTPPPTQEAGVMTVTPEEASALKGTSATYWTMQSTTPQGAITESAFSGGITQTNRNIQTKNLYLSNWRNILAGQEQYKQYSQTVKDFKADPSSFEGKVGVVGTSTQEGTSYELTPKYFENTINTKNIYADALTGAKARFESLPGGTKARLKASSYGVGVSSAVIGVGEFGATMVANMGMATSDESGKFQKRTVKFGGTLGEIRNYPATPTTYSFTEKPGQWIKEKATAPEFLGQATVIVPMFAQGGYSTFKNIKTYGWKAGTVETLAGVSPFKIRSGIYSPSVKPELYQDTKVFKFTNKGGITTKVYGKDYGGVKLRGYEQSGKIKGQTVGGGLITTETPYMAIRGGGVYTQTGIKTTGQYYTFLGKGSGTSGAIRDPATSFLLPQRYTVGGASVVWASKPITAYTSATGTKYTGDLSKAYLYTSGGSAKDFGGGKKFFVGGQAEAGYKMSGAGTDTRILSPSGKYRFKPTVSGFEYDLNVIFGGAKSGAGSLGTGSGTGGGYTSGGGRTLLKFDGGTATKLKLGGGTGIMAPTPTTTTVSQPTQSTFIPPATVTKPPKTSQISYPGVKTTVKIKAPEVVTKPDTTTITIPEISTRPRSRGRSRTATITIPKIDQVTTQQPTQDTIQAPVIIPVQKIRQDQISRKATATLNFPSSFGRPNYPYEYSTPRPIPTVKIPTFAGGGRFLKLGNVKAVASPTRYTPSFSALFFKIRGKAPRGTPTGIRFRPITSGFSYSRKKIRVRRIKI